VTPKVAAINELDKALTFYNPLLLNLKYRKSFYYIKIAYIITSKL